MLLLGHAAQDENTRYVCIGPVNKCINTLACWLEDPDGEPFKRCAYQWSHCLEGTYASLCFETDHAGT